MRDFCKKNMFPYLLNLENKFSATDCLRICPRLEAGGRVPSIINSTNSQNAVEEYRKTLFYSKQKLEVFIVAPFVWDSSKGFIDYYTKDLMPLSLWVPGQPNGNESQPFTGSDTSRNDGLLLDIPNKDSRGLSCQCDFPDQPLLRLRGLCKDSNIDNTFTIVSHEGSVICKGLTNTEIKFSKIFQLPTWILSVHLGKTQATANAEETSYALGELEWTISNDSVRCNNGKPYTKTLQLSACLDGEFTCSNGDCITMDQRCDQVLDCMDKSDEVKCNTIVLEKSYRKSAPPVSAEFVKARKLVPVAVKISFDLLDIASIREADNEIDIKLLSIWNGRKRE